MSNIEEIRKRHEFDGKHAIKVAINWHEFAREPWIAKRIRASGVEQELLKDVNGTLQERHQDRGVLLDRIAELEHQLAGCTCPTVAQLRRLVEVSDE